MKRVLLVSPHFPPVSAADMHRVRMLLPFFAREGWQAEVLAVEPAQVAHPLDPLLEAGLPADVPVHWARALSLRWARIPGLGTLGLRCLPALARAGDALLARGDFDLVYFSTTAFEVHVLGPRWRRRYGVPFVMDYQDAWVSDYYRDNPAVPVPGGRWKYRLASTLHRWMEPRVLRACAGITSVSPAYPRQLAARYPVAMASMPTLVQGFPGAPRDFDRLPSPSGADAPFDPGDGAIHWVYVGRGGPDMQRALRAFFRALRDHADPALLRVLRLHFIGTSYAAAGTGARTAAPIAEEFGLGDLVRESPDRISYTLTLWCLRNAHALIVPGSDDPAYTASKIYPYLLARRPMLAVFHRDSSVVDLVARAGGAVCVPFDARETEDALAAAIARDWLEPGAHARVVDLDMAAFAPYTDAGCATAMARFFDACAATPAGAGAVAP
jgi:hypothetical protein